MKNTIIKKLAKTIIATAFILMFLAITASVTAHSQTKPAKPKQKPVNVDSIEANKPHYYTRNPDFTFYYFKSHIFKADDGHDYLVYTDGKTYASVIPSVGCRLCAKNCKRNVTTPATQEEMNLERK